MRVLPRVRDARPTGDLPETRAVLGLQRNGVGVMTAIVYELGPRARITVSVEGRDGDTVWEWGGPVGAIRWELVDDEMHFIVPQPLAIRESAE